MEISNKSEGWHSLDIIMYNMENSFALNTYIFLSHDVAQVTFHLKVMKVSHITVTAVGFL